MALCLPVSEWQNYCIRNQIFKFWSLLLHKAVVFDSTVPLLADLHQWFLILQYLCKHLYLLICISGFWLYSICASASSSVLVQTLLLADEHDQWCLVLQYLCKRLCLLISISGFWFYNTCANAPACSSASMIFGSTVLMQVPLLADKLQWSLVRLQYLCWHFCLLMSSSGFWFCSTCASASACWVADIKW